MSGYRQTYTLYEELEILKYIIDTEGESQIRSDGLWKNMETTFENRTWQSLKNHFQRVMIPKLSSYDLPRQQIQKIQNAYTATKNLAIAKRWEVRKQNANKKYNFPDMLNIESDEDE